MARSLVSDTYEDVLRILCFSRVLDGVAFYFP